MTTTKTRKRLLAQVIPDIPCVREARDTIAQHFEAQGIDILHGGKPSLSRITNVAVEDWAVAIASGGELPSVEDVQRWMLTYIQQGGTMERANVEGHEGVIRLAESQERWDGLEAINKSLRHIHAQRVFQVSQRKTICLALMRYAEKVTTERGGDENR